MRLIGSILLLAGLAISSQASAVALLGQEPDPSRVINTGNGLEWVWAAPCAGEDPSCGGVQLHHGFRFATADEWISSFLNLQGLITAFNIPNSTLFNNEGTCSAPEFSTNYDQCNGSDVHLGAVWHAPIGIASALYVNDPAAETFLVRTAAVPAPATLALMGLGLAGIGFARKKKQA
ncbi:MAG: PEP-CTERM sorting domain-containing protein [Sedimenticola sp.]